MPCQLTPVSEVLCDFKGKANQQVTLTLKGTVGTVQFEKAEYGGAAIPNLPATDLTFALKAGKVPLDVVYVFSNGSSGRGELHEKCENNTLLDDWVRGDNPVERYNICCENGGQ